MEGQTHLRLQILILRQGQLIFFIVGWFPKLWKRLPLRGGIGLIRPLPDINSTRVLHPATRVPTLPLAFLYQSELFSPLCTHHATQASPHNAGLHPYNYLPEEREIKQTLQPFASASTNKTTNSSIHLQIILALPPQPTWSAQITWKKTFILTPHKLNDFPTNFLTTPTKKFWTPNNFALLLGQSLLPPPLTNLFGLPARFFWFPSQLLLTALQKCFTQRLHITKTSPQAKRHKPSLLFTSLTIFTFITR